MYFYFFIDLQLTLLMKYSFINNKFSFHLTFSCFVKCCIGKKVFKALVICCRFLCSQNFVIRFTQVILSVLLVNIQKARNSEAESSLCTSILQNV